MIEQLFFELIRVAIGTQERLTRPPLEKEWQQLYAMAKKQSLVGICFAGLRRLYNSVNQEPSTQNPQPNSTQNQALELCSLRSAGAEEPITHNLDEVQYLTWMGMAAKIQQRNEVVNRQCAELQKRLSGDGLRSCVLKGQGVAVFYRQHNNTSTSSAQADDDTLRCDNLSMLRQSGDIDLWIPADYQQTIDYLKKEGVAGKITANHAEANFFNDTEVEIHPIPAIFRNPITNRIWRSFCKEHETECMTNKVCLYDNDGFDKLKNRDDNDNTGICVPTTEFNLVFLMVHMYQHLLREGIGLRQFLDYYFVLRNFQQGSKLDKKGSAKKAVLTKTEKTAAASAGAQIEPLTNDCSPEIVSVLPSSANHSYATLSGSADTSAKNIKNIVDRIDKLGMKRFAAGVMDIVHNVFGMPEEELLCEPDPEAGAELLSEIMTGGNFGHYDERNKVAFDNESNPIHRVWSGIKRNRRFLKYGFWEIAWSPIWRLWHFCWMKMNGYR